MTCHFEGAPRLGIASSNSKVLTVAIRLWRVEGQDHTRTALADDLGALSYPALVLVSLFHCLYVYIVGLEEIILYSSYEVFI